MKFSGLLFAEELRGIYEMREPNLQSTGSPLLFRGAVPRVSHPEIPGAYDHEQQVWTVETRSGRAPIVIAESVDLLEIETKTRVREEADDEAPGLTEITTKTAVTQESDDESRAVGLVEMATKTLVVEESDDDIQSLSLLLELATKTEAQAEHDDVSRPII